MAQKNIDYGLFPDDQSADAIRIAFQKTQDNFTELYGNLANLTTNVTGINAGTGIQVSSNTGNVTVSANLNLLNVHSDTLNVTGTGPGGAITPGGIANRDYTITSANSTLVIELNPNVNLTYQNISISEDLIVGDSIIVDTGNILLNSGNISLANGQINGKISTSAPPNSLLFSNNEGLIFGTSVLNFDQANTLLSVENGTIRAQDIIANNQISAYQFSSNSATISENLNANSITVTQQLNVSSIAVSNNIIANSPNTFIFARNINAQGNINALTLAGNGQGVSNLNANNISSGRISANLLTGTYDISVTGSANTAATVTTAAQPNITSVGNLSSLTVSGILNSSDISSVGNITALKITASSANINSTSISNSGINTANGVFTGPITTSYYLTAVGNVSANNIIATTSVSAISGSFSGEVTANSISTGNLASDNLVVNSTANVLTLETNELNSLNITINNRANVVDLYANRATVTGNIISNNFSASGSITGNNIYNNGALVTNNIISNTSVAANSLSVSANISANTIVANTVSTNTVQSPILKLIGLPSDPVSASPGDMYYNISTGKFRGYNGVLSQWDDLN